MKKFLPWLIGAIGVAIALIAIHEKRRTGADEEQQNLHNPFEGLRVRFVEDENDPVNADGVRGHLALASISDVKYSNIESERAGFYERYVKRVIDVVLSSCTLVLLSPLFAVISLAIVLDDPRGGVVFTQKRVGINKHYFNLHKFRSMKSSSPSDIPTHMLGDAESYITRVGRVLRVSSLDELPQLYDILIGNMSIIGTRPALWNQDKLIALRDGWDIDANSAKPGLTGLAQIKGRDELDLAEKAAIDREYVRVLRAGGIKAFIMDLKCFFGTIKSVLHHDGVVEGGTGNLKGE